MEIKLLDFYADWCGPCKKQTPIVEEIKEDYEDDDRLTVEKIDIDEKEDMANEYNVRSIPTIIILEDDEVKHKFTGLTKKDDLVDSVEKLI
jgi:thioredoxin 1